MDQELQRIERVNDVTRARRDRGQTLLFMQQRAVGRRHGRHLESVTAYRKSNSIGWCVFT